LPADVDPDMRGGGAFSDINNLPLSLLRALSFMRIALLCFFPPSS
jgi:hypothetical protein